eukprot:g3212.t1
MQVFVTVGTTSFDALVRTVDGSACRGALRRKGFGSMTVQIGRGEAVPRAEGDTDLGIKGAEGLRVEHFRHEPTLVPHVARADLVISHGGAGTIMEVLRARKPLIVVTNEALMGNHQTELAGALEERGHLVATTPERLLDALERFDAAKLVPYGEADGSLFRDMLDAEMGFQG